MVTNPILAIILTYLLYVAMLLLQGWLAGRMKRLSPEQRGRSDNDLTLASDGGTWTTYIIVLPLAFYAIGTYGQHWSEDQVTGALVLAAILTAVWNLYDSTKTPDGQGAVNSPFRQKGSLTWCGWVRVVRTMLTIAVFTTFFIDRRASLQAHFIATGFLTVHIIFGTHFGLRTYAAYKKWRKDGYRGRDVIAFVFNGPACVMVASCFLSMVGMSLLMNR